MTTNVFEPEWDMEIEDGPLRGRASRIGRQAGSVELGATIYEIAPGASGPPYHFHHGNEELLIVLSGAPELRTPEGRRALAPGDVVAFARGPEGAHGLRNPTGDPVRVLIASTQRFPDVAEHPDTGATLTLVAAEQGRVFPIGTDVPPLQAVVAAIDAGVEA